MSQGSRFRLSAMMALIYAVQGAFWPLLGIHLQDLGISGRYRGWIFATYAIGSFAVPLGAGQLVDRWLATQHVLAGGYAIGAVLLILPATGWVTSGAALFALFLGFFSIIGPMYALSNSLTMRHLEDPQRDFGKIRLWGTVGWMAIGWIVSTVMIASGSVRTGHGTYEAFWIAAACAAILSVWCLTLPHTPPLATGGGRQGGLAEGLELLRNRDVVIFLITAFGVTITTPVIFQIMPGYLESRGLPRSWVATVMTLGQWLELAGLAVLPWLLNRIGYKGTLLLGIGSLVVRFLSLAFAPPLWLAVAGTFLHGLSSGCFIIGGQVYIDSQAPGHRRASAQALLSVVTAGLGCLVGSVLAGELAGSTWVHPSFLVFFVPFVIDGVLFIFLLTTFRTRREPVESKLEMETTVVAASETSRPYAGRLMSTVAGTVER